MSKEILDAVRALATEKNISSEKLMVALEDALLSAYKKTPGAAPYAQVEMDRELGDFTVWELQIPEELEALYDATVGQKNKAAKKAPATKKATTNKSSIKKTATKKPAAKKTAGKKPADKKAAQAG